MAEEIRLAKPCPRAMGGVRAMGSVGRMWLTRVIPLTAWKGGSVWQMIGYLVFGERRLCMERSRPKGWLFSVNCVR